MSLPASDTFTGTNGTNLPTYSANWSAVLNNLYIQTNAVAPNAAASTDCSARWNADTFPNNQYAQITIAAIITGKYIGPAVRMKTDNTVNLYGYYADGAPTAFMFKVVAGTGSQLGSTDNINTHAVNDVLRIEAVGTTITPKRNGTTNSTIGAATDSSHVSGTGGVCGSGVGTTTRGDSWSAGSLGATVLSATVDDSVLLADAMAGREPSFASFSENFG